MEMQITVTDAKGIEANVSVEPLFPGAQTMRVNLDGRMIGSVDGTMAGILLGFGATRIYRFPSSVDAMAACVSNYRYGYWTNER
jgi:hypothetical protein